MKCTLPLFLLLPLTIAGCDAPKPSNTAAPMAGMAMDDHKMAGHKMDGHEMKGDAMGKHHAIAPTMTLTLAPAGGFVLGKPQAVNLTLIDAATGKPMGADDVAIAHTKKLHLLIVDASLTDYQHIHPQPDPAKPGSWRFDFAPRFATTYKVWADITRPSGTQEYVKADLVAGSQPAPKPGTTVLTKAVMDGLTFSLSFSGPLKVGQGAEGSIGITDSKTGQPFTGLQPIMGAFGHIVAFAGDWNAIEHVHPMAAEPKVESARSGPVIRFHIQPEQAGTLKLFAQVRANGRETIVPFTQSVQP